MEYSPKCLEENVEITSTEIPPIQQFIQFTVVFIGVYKALVVINSLFVTKTKTRVLETVKIAARYFNAGGLKLFQKLLRALFHTPSIL